CGEVSTECALSVVSGYARGVDMAAHVAALQQGGKTVVVLPEGIHRFRLKREIAEVWDSARTLVVSQFSPSQPWTTGAAMGRNTVILGMGLSLIVVEARDKGGTLAAGMAALKLNRRVITLEFADGEPQGNALLRKRGAVPVRSRDHLVQEL